MLRVTLSEEEQVIASSGNGASVAELMADGRLAFKRRTLQRRLDLLCEGGLLFRRERGEDVVIRYASKPVT